MFKVSVGILFDCCFCRLRFACLVVGKKHIPQIGALMVIYPGRIRKQSPEKQIQEYIRTR